MLCVLGFQELANVISLSHPGEKRRTNLQDRKYFQVSKGSSIMVSGVASKGFGLHLWVFICQLQVPIRFIDSQIAVLSFYFVSCNSLFCWLMIWIKVGHFGVIHFVSMSMQKIISLPNQLPISVVFGSSFHMGHVQQF